MDYRMEPKTKQKQKQKKERQFLGNLKQYGLSNYNLRADLLLEQGKFKQNMEYL